MEADHGERRDTVGLERSEGGEGYCKRIRRRVSYVCVHYF